jgi:hypothetical protein
MREHDPAWYAFDVLLELAEDGNEFARAVITAHPDDGRGRTVCGLCLTRFQTPKGEDPVSLAANGLMVCSACADAVTPLPAVDYTPIEERVLAQMAADIQAKGFGADGMHREIAMAQIEREEVSPTGRLPSTGPEMQSLSRPVKPGAIGSPEWKKRMARFMGGK